MQVLVVEPDRILAGAYRAAFETAGHTVVYAVSAEGAIEKVDAELPDVIVLSSELARHNGVEFLYEFRSYADWQDVPVVLLTNMPRSDLVANASLQQQLGVRSVLVRAETSNAELVHAVEQAARQKA